jgi:hypothetical protein
MINVYDFFLPNTRKFRTLSNFRKFLAPVLESKDSKPQGPFSAVDRVLLFKISGSFVVTIIQLWVLFVAGFDYSLLHQVISFALFFQRLSVGNQRYVSLIFHLQRSLPVGIPLIPLYEVICSPFSSTNGLSVISSMK